MRVVPFLVSIIVTIALVIVLSVPLAGIPPLGQISESSAWILGECRAG